VSDKIDFSKPISVDPNRIGFRLIEVVVSGERYKVSLDFDKQRQISGLGAASEKEVFQAQEGYILDWVAKCPDPKPSPIVIDP
jgi:hypothetical protein